MKLYILRRDHSDFLMVFRVSIGDNEMIDFLKAIIAVNSSHGLFFVCHYDLHKFYHRCGQRKLYKCV